LGKKKGLGKCDSHGEAATQKYAAYWRETGLVFTEADVTAAISSAGALCVSEADLRALVEAFSPPSTRAPEQQPSKPASAIDWKNESFMPLLLHFRYIKPQFC
jgi:hypothetical protein